MEPWPAFTPGAPTKRSIAPVTGTSGTIPNAAPNLAVELLKSPAALFMG